MWWSSDFDWTAGAGFANNQKRTPSYIFKDLDYNPANIALVFLLLILNIFNNFSSTSIIGFEQVNLSWEDQKFA